MTPAKEKFCRSALVILSLAVVLAARPCAAQAPAAPPPIPSGEEAPPFKTPSTPAVEGALDDKFPAVPLVVPLTEKPVASKPAVVKPDARKLKSSVTFTGPDGRPKTATTTVEMPVGVKQNVAVKVAIDDVVIPADGLDLGYDRPDAFVPRQIVSPFLPPYLPWPPPRNQQIEIPLPQPLETTAPPGVVIESP